MQDYIEIRGAKANNLKNLSCRLPRDKFTVITGISGSGKSSLAFDTIFAEGQRRYMQSLSSFARQFLGVLEKPQVDEIKGLSPALAIDQKTSLRSPRSTVGTMSEIYDYLRLMFTHIGTPHCLHCLTKMTSQGKSWQCPKCQYKIYEMAISQFSFNSPEGACPDCEGLGVKLEVDPCLVIPNTKLTLNEGAIRPWQRMITGYLWQKQALEKLAQKLKFSFGTAIKDLPPAILQVIVYGDESQEFEGVIPNLAKKHKETSSDYIQKEIEKYMVKKTCPTCQGARLKQQSLLIKVNGLSIADYAKLNIEKLYRQVSRLAQNHRQLSPEQRKIVHQVLEEMCLRVKYMLDVGLNYLTLDRGSDTLAGGEAQRIRLATQLGSGLMGVIYILDEPTIGLHPCDQRKLLDCLLTLRDLGNTVIVVEHEKAIIKAADYILDIGPGAGQLGGKIVASGSFSDIKNSSSITGDYLKGKKQIEIGERPARVMSDWLEIKGAAQFNLKNIDVKFPLGFLTCVTGVSGSGKSTLVDHILVRQLRQHFFQAKTQPGQHQAILGLEKIGKIISITQLPIGRNVRSNPATYTGLLGHLRELFAGQPLAQKRGYSPAQFSFNLKIGRCPECRGDGVLRFEMHFLPNVYITCSSCGGKRFNPQTLEVKYQGKNIADALKMTVNEAAQFFSQELPIMAKLKVLQKVGLGYIRLGQNAPDLSGGEAQRIKLATELSRASAGNTLYVLDEPTTGLHFDDINRLLKVIAELVDSGNTVIVVEHNLDVIKNVDWIIDLGPGGGDKGGYLVAQGPPDKIIKCSRSLTGKFLKSIYHRSPAVSNYR